MAIHHPLDWLAAFDGDSLRTQLEGAGLLVLSGHEHEADPTSAASARGGLVQDRAGCLYESQNYRNSYSIVDLRPRDPRIVSFVREWYPDRSPRGVFDGATRLAEEGKVVLSIGSHISRGHPAYSEVVSALTTLVQDRSVIFDTAAPEDKQTIDQLLVPPRLYTVPYQEARATGKRDGLQPPDPLAALAAGKVILICGDSHEDGVTSTLLWLLASQYEFSDEYFPSYLSSSNALGTRDGDNVLRNATAQLGLPRTSGELPDLMIAIDDVDEKRPKRLDRLARFISENGRHRFVAGTHGSNHAALAAALERSGVDYMRIFVWPFGTRQLRGLVSRVDGQEDDLLVRQVSGLLRSNRLPRSPFIMAALIAVLRAHGDLSTVNESSVLTAYANLLLGGIDVDDAEGLGQDYRRREYLLGCIAKELLQSDEERITRYEAERFVTEYFGG